MSCITTYLTRVQSTEGMSATANSAVHAQPIGLIGEEVGFTAWLLHLMRRCPSPLAGALGRTDGES